MLATVKPGKLYLHILNWPGAKLEIQAEKIEEDLMRLCPRDQWIALAHRLIEHGRRVCTARKPKCDECVLNDECPRVGVGRG